MKPTTIKDIAKALSINPSTVSRGLKKHPDISEELQKRIEETAKLMNYHPNQLAISFRNRHSKLIGLILPDIPMYYFPGVIKAVMTEAQQKGYNLIMLQSNEDAERELENVEICKQMNVEGLLVCVTKNTYDYEPFHRLETSGVPIVYFDKTPNQTVNHSVTFDDVEVAKVAVQHLLACGARKIACVLGNANLSITQKRKRGCELAVTSFSEMLTVDFICANTSEEARVEITQKSKGSFDGIFCMSDEVLAGVMQALHFQAYKIPDKVQVVAISDGIIPYYFQPPITFVKTSGYDTGKTACLELLRLLEEHDENSPRQIIQPTELILNHSTKTIIV